MTIEDRLEALENELQDFKDRKAILDCIQRECRARDRQDVEQIEGCWWDDGIDEHGPKIYRMPGIAEAFNASHQARLRSTSHHITNHLCEIVGDMAFCESYTLANIFLKDSDTTILCIGRYVDRLEKRNGEWRLLMRACVLDMSVNADGSGVHSWLAGYRKGLWSRDDTSYDRNFVVGGEAMRW